ncbi:MAG: hypothetical protein FWC19_05330 [Treponema sp.]|nr:hypothetical protein [Treponema sp.]MCL2272210.1 hypothetical protein [Treponema sp.]
MLNQKPDDFKFAKIKKTPVKIAALCIVSAVLNHIIFPLFVLVFKLPLFVDTVFTAAITFYAGLIPGLITAVLTWVIGFAIKNDIVTPFILCSIAEVFIIFLLKPAALNLRGLSKGRKRAVFIGVLARLMMLYITVCIVISILGGVIDFIFYTVLPNAKPAFSAEDAFKEWLFHDYLPVLAMNILSRLPVNIVDRFIVIFGGYFISCAIIKIPDSDI